MFEVYNSAGSLMVDHNYMNHALVQRGWVNANSDPIGMGLTIGGFIDITYSGGEAPVIAWRSDAFVGLLGFSQNGGDFTFRLYCQVRGHGLDYYIFDRPRPNPGNWGLQVFDGAGRLTFDGSQKYMKVAALHEADANGALFSEVTEEWTLWLDGSRLYATATQIPSAYVLMVGMKENPTNPASRWIWDRYSRMCGARSGWGQITAGSFLLQRDSGSTGAAVPPSYTAGTLKTRFMAVDITHI